MGKESDVEKVREKVNGEVKEEVKKEIKEVVRKEVEEEAAVQEEALEKEQEKEQEKELDTESESETEQTGDWLKVEFESLSKNEELARVIAAVFASRLDPTLEELDDIKTAVSEAVTNAIRHGYREEAGIVVMEMEIDDRTIRIHVADGGVGIENISQAMEPMYSSDPEGESAGMGFSLMQSFMDTVYVESELGKGTRVTMTKTINR